ncbi:hypothetical protein PVAP13_9NG479314 [Panicum virgatum]|uniref:Uncharacterized protein n=1 Tax=Panicum virgatum TaxID=38727 RepID=A0A8T0MTR0_PANVG|nr:hypothetical protein PVAP13_9NG479314 [Panicum virgatum]
MPELIPWGHTGKRTGIMRKSLKEAARVICRVSRWRFGATFFFIDRMMARCAKIESRVSTTSSGKRKFVTCPSQNHWWWFVQERPKETQAALASNPREFASVGGFGSTS